MKILKQQNILNRQSENYIAGELSNVAMVLQTPQLFVEYFSIDVDASPTVDGFKNVEDFIHEDSPIIYNRIENLPMSGIDNLISQAQFDEELGFDEDFQSSGIIFPNTIVPKPDDCFIVNGSQVPALYKVTNVSPITVRSNPFVEIEFRLFSRNTETIAQLRRQVKDDYLTTVTAIGMDKTLVIKKESYFSVEQHVSQYESLKDTNATWLEDLLLHEYTECYLYYSCYMIECDRYIKRIWEECLIQEIAHLNKAKEFLWKYERKEWQQVIPCGNFPSILKLGSNIEYVRNIIATTTGNTQRLECVVPLDDLKENAPFFFYQSTVNNDVHNVASHEVIAKYIQSKSCDYRYEVAEHPICVLRDRTCDNTGIGRIPSETPDSTSICGTTSNNCNCHTQSCDGKINR